MDNIRQYILSVISISVLCGLVQLLFVDNTTVKSIIKIIAGFLVTVTVISPLLNCKSGQLEEFIRGIDSCGDYAVMQGKEMAANMTAEIIKEEVEKYIIDKANTFGVTISVDVGLQEGTIPKLAEVTVKGAVSPYVKNQIADWMQRELGINEDHQIWIS